MGDPVTVTRYPAGYPARSADFWCAMGPMFASAAVRRALQTIHDEPATDEWFVATDAAGAVVSFACLRRGKGAAAELCHCYTVPESRGAGASARVKADLIAAARAGGVEKLTAVASLAHKSGLEKAGFKPLKQQPKKKWDYTVMEMKL